MKARTTLLALALLAPAALALMPAAGAAGTVRLVAFGDTSANSLSQKNVDGALAEGAEAFLGLGDYNYDHSVSAWKTMFAPLTSKGAYLAIGNHDDQTQLSSLFPEGTQWSKAVGGVRIVALNGMRDFAVGSASYETVRGYLCDATEGTKVLLTHHNWWLESGAHHPGTEFRGSESAMDRMMVDCGVDLVLAGHEHNYQRMVRNGVQYVIAGTGGRGLYPVAGTPSGTVATCECLGRVVLDAGPDGYSAQFKALDGTVKDAFSGGAAAPSPAPSPTPSPAPSPTPTFTPKAGNEWWVQVKVSGSPSAVHARDTGGDWKALTLRSWGDWAGSFHVEPGHQVQYRATVGGATVESCWYAGTACAAGTSPAPSPAPSPSPSPSSAFAATWKNVRGNAWWVESDVAVAGGTLAKVEARSDGGAWIALEKKSWGSWAKSFRVGSAVELRATSTTGATSVSGSFAWPPG